MQTPGRRRWISGSLVALMAAAGAAGLEAQQGYTGGERDARVGLRAGLFDAEIATRGMELVSTHPRPTGFYDMNAIGNLDLANSDLAFQGDRVIVGSFTGFQIFDVSDRKAPRLEVAVMCPGGQGDVSVHGNLVFMSVQDLRARVDCGTQGVDAVASPERLRGVRIFDISDVRSPRQVAAVQTCRGSHTHTLVSDPNDPSRIFVYVSGTSPPRPTEELAGCSGAEPGEDPNTSLFRIEVIEVPLAAPQNARVVSEPRIFADRETGDIAGLWPGGDHGPGTQDSRRTDRCHDITAYPEIGLAAGACSGNGILLDIRDPANPVRIHEVVDPSMVFWHSATFNNDGTKIIFTDEWGGGTAPRCRVEDPRTWGANAIFDVRDGRMEFASYYKLPAPQEEVENCVAHNGSLVPVPGRDIKVQGWYQGGISVFDFTDSRNPVEIAYFDRGPISATQLEIGGHWGAYWYNGYVFGSEMARGLDVLRLTPSDQLSANEIAAANLVRFEEFNPQMQPRYDWPAHFVVSRAYLDQLARNDGLAAARRTAVAGELDRLEGMAPGAQRTQGLETLARQLEQDAASAGDGERVRWLAESVRKLAR